MNYVEVRTFLQCINPYHVNCDDDECKFEHVFYMHHDDSWEVPLGPQVHALPPFLPLLPVMALVVPLAPPIVSDYRQIGQWNRSFRVTRLVSAEVIAAEGRYPAHLQWKVKGYRAGSDRYTTTYVSDLFMSCRALEREFFRAKNTTRERYFLRYNVDFEERKNECYNCTEIKGAQQMMFHCHAQCAGGHHFCDWVLCYTCCVRAGLSRVERPLCICPPCGGQLSF